MGFYQGEKILLAERDNHWLIVDFDYEIEVLDNISFKLSELIKEAGLTLEER